MFAANVGGVPIDVTCQACGNISSVPDTAAGARRFCKMCGTPFVVPGGAAPAKPAAPDPSAASLDLLDFGPAPAKKAAPKPGGAFAASPHPSTAWTAPPVRSDAAPARQFTQKVGSPAGARTAARPGTADRKPPEQQDDPYEVHSDLPYLTQDEDDDPSLLDYPCRVCEKLFLSTAIYAEPDGDTICKMCWRELAHEPAVAASALPGALELAPASARQLPPDGQIFCERCRRILKRDKLHVESDGAVLCANCSRKRKLKLKIEERQAEKLKEMADPAKRRNPVDKQAMVKNGLMVAGAIGALGLLAYTLKSNGIWFEKEKPVHNAKTR